MEVIDLVIGLIFNGVVIKVGVDEVVYQVIGIGIGVGELVLNVQFFVDYIDFVYLYIMEFVSGILNEWCLVYILVDLLSGGDVGVIDVI